MTVEMVFTVIAAIAAITGIILNWWNAHKKGVTEEAARQSQTVSLAAQLTSISDDVKEIKVELKLKDTRLTDHEIRIAALEKRSEA